MFWEIINKQKKERKKKMSASDGRSPLTSEARSPMPLLYRRHSSDEVRNLASISSSLLPAFGKLMGEDSANLGRFVIAPYDRRYRYIYTLLLFQYHTHTHTCIYIIHTYIHIDVCVRVKHPWRCSRASAHTHASVCVFLRWGIFLHLLFSTNLNVKESLSNWIKILKC